MYVHLCIYMYVHTHYIHGHPPSSLRMCSPREGSEAQMLATVVGSGPRPPPDLITLNQCRMDDGASRVNHVVWAFEATGVELLLKTDCCARSAEGCSARASGG